MVEYRIRIDYSTGNSFGSHDVTDYLEFTWKNLDIVKENLRWIKEHYEMYRSIHNYGNKLKREQIFFNNKDKDWFVNIPKLYCISSNNAISEKDKNKVGEGNWEYRPDECAEYCLKLKLDNENDMQMSAFWCGHFEELHTAKIEIAGNDDDMEINF